jgi:hypothetical protein
MKKPFFLFSTSYWQFLKKILYLTLYHITYMFNGYNLNIFKKCLAQKVKHNFEIWVQINCIICKGKLVFYNKCQLLRHAREHTQNDNPMKFINPKITPLTIKMCLPRSKAPDLHSKFSKSCSECETKFATRIGLQEHMQRKTDVHNCDACSMTLPNL